MPDNEGSTVVVDEVNRQDVEMVPGGHGPITQEEAQRARIEERAELAAMKARPAAEVPATPAEPSAWSAADLIRRARENPPEPVIEGLLNVGEILLIHGSEEAFKSVFAVQIAESVASRTPLLRIWPLPHARRVGLIETEMHEAQLGERLHRMFSDGNAPGNMRFFTEAQLRAWRRQALQGKFRMIERWVSNEQIEVLIVDTANDFFRGHDSPSEETVVGEFFDRLRNLPVRTCVLVRHDRKHRMEDFGAHSNEQIRGSAEWKEDPEAIIHLKRKDRRTHEVMLEVGKLRYGIKPEPISAWFDAGCFRLVPVLPVIAILEPGPRSRQEIIDQCRERFGLADRTVDETLGQLAQQGFLRQRQRRHKRIYEIDRERCAQAP